MLCYNYYQANGSARLRAVRPRVEIRGTLHFSSLSISLVKKGVLHMNWHLRSAYVKAMYILIIILSLIAAGTADTNWA